MVSTLAERFRRAILSDDLASAKTIAQRALAETCNEAHPFDIRNQTILRTTGHSHHRNRSSSSAGSSSNGASSNIASGSTMASANESSILATSQAILPALSESQHHFAKQSRVRERNRQAGRCKSSLALAIEKEASIEMIQWLLDMGHERGQYTRDYRNCTMVSLAAQHNRTDVIEALCVDAVANAASVHHRESILFGNGFNRRQRGHLHEDDEGDESYDYESGVAKLSLQQDGDRDQLRLEDDGRKVDRRVTHLGGQDTPTRSSIDKDPSPMPLQQYSDDSVKDSDKMRSSSDEINDDLIGKEVLYLLDSPDELGRTPLALSCMKGFQETVTHLLDLGASINLADYEGNTPLHYAASYNHLLIVQLLIERGCSFATKNNFGFTAADYAYTSNLKGALEAFARAKFERDGKGGTHGDDSRAVQTNNKIKQTLLASAKSLQSSLQYRLGH
jgi:hypothetical protein